MNASEHSKQSEVLPNTDGFDLNEWVRKQKATDDVRFSRFEALERVASQFSSELLGVSGLLIDELISHHPRMIPKDFWGGDLGWRSAKRQQRWEDSLAQNGIVASPINSGLLIRCYVDPAEWVPHPYLPPHWTLSDFAVFSNFVAPSKEAFNLCGQWTIENNQTLTRRLADRIQNFPVKIGASFIATGNYADIAFLLPDRGTEMLRIQTVWKGEAALAELVKHNFPDACREYSAPWLMGQRIDVFIPSLQVGLEYNGEQRPNFYSLARRAG